MARATCSTSIKRLIRQREMLNFVGIVERSNWHVESWTEQGTHEECAADFNGWHPEIHEIIHNIETPYKWALLEREPLARWSFGRVTLLGDAAHPMLPMMVRLVSILELESSSTREICFPLRLARPSTRDRPIILERFNRPKIICGV